MLLVGVSQKLPEAAKGKEKSQERSGANKGEEVAVVSAAHTIVQPDTMVIKCLNAVVAHPAVIASRWSPNVACLTVFDRDVHSGGLRSSQSNHHPIISWWADC